MKLSDFDFKLPEELIATHPVEPRDSARLMLVDRKNGNLADLHFHDLVNFLEPDDFLVFNSSKVIPARLFGKVMGEEVEVLLVRDRGHGEWEAIGKPGKRLKKGVRVEFDDGLICKIIKSSEGVSIIKFNMLGKRFWEMLDKIGETPLPPYILKQRHEWHDEDVDIVDYQTVYADVAGSVAAPTAGLHFTTELLEKIKSHGCEIGFVDLHVGLGTFEPIHTENVEDHKIHSEYFELSKSLADKLNRAKSEGRRIVAVGTTTVRVLESCQKGGVLEAKTSDTNIYITPGYRFGFVDALITNFHTPKSSLLVLVSAFYNREEILKIYKEAIQKKYRFYSYGDGMFIV